jgi:hypothetical protein
MQPYGLYPKIPMGVDVGDIHHCGLKGSFNSPRGKGGDIRSAFKCKDKKARVRREYKRIARRAGKVACCESE